MASNVTIGMLGLGGMLITDVVRPVGIVVGACDESYIRGTKHKGTDCMLAPSVDMPSKRPKKMNVCQFAKEMPYVCTMRHGH